MKDTLDRGHIKELLAAAGVGLTSQVVEGYAWKLLGGLLGMAGGGLMRGVGKQAASSAMSFASTYALGHLAKQYYGSGRVLSAAQLRELFGSLTQQARSLHGRYAGQIEQQAGQTRATDPPVDPKALTARASRPSRRWPGAPGSRCCVPPLVDTSANLPSRL